jgi:hypothetical protein
MRQFGKLGVLLLLLVSYVAPAMACVFPDTNMTQQERACCLSMKNDCGQMQMPPSHGCCQKLPSSAHLQMVQVKPTDVHPITVAIVWLTAIRFLYPSLVPSEGMLRTVRAEPESPPRSITVLRI